jgi:UDP-N-acetylmuramoylalanine--D-glutamate ligase
MDNLHIIVGLGVTAISVANFLTQHNIPFAVADTRSNPPSLAQFKELYPHVKISLGPLQANFLTTAAKIIVSPGVSLKEPVINQMIQNEKIVIGDIELFAAQAKAPVIAITGTNAKSTVTTLVGLMAKNAGLRVKVGGNLGIPALDLLDDTSDVYVLELSSFQLETTFTLAPQVATILNITPDHMDRHQTLAAYQAAKQRIYNHCQIAVCNKDDLQTDCVKTGITKIYFTLDKPSSNEFGILRDSESYLAFGEQKLLSVKKLPVLGRHYHANALAALALGHSFGLPMQAMLQTLIEFKGLEHRCQFIRELNGVAWYNDSKGTNVGATLAAIEGLGPEIAGQLILIAGGVGKNADFTPLIPALKKYAKIAILIGEAAPELIQILSPYLKTQYAENLDQAVAYAKSIAAAGDSVLLSPACASFDMFKNFEHRGTVFTEVVQGLQ